ncbi:cystatin A2 [Dictyostelium discoideum AX4]|uniref:Cystatin-A2 n=2 Tax=Dictyostelium discoideum TaxID=44689 RepID=CYTA2_DICDI|nr:cystatin A2 [Dictyostelium discoideum AX4]Q65YR7.1 RecName: Full=Cystatin-A2 [Dictyostelium discoideum]EAL67198.1 cystatin A2 [Dictyostelium discoideum AX4]BAD44694.1 cystatin A2 [Dictyostelium discoideum]|eukprot:XP_641175.1 cystatin A2 [Dictyostelium discoideum AX4]
MTKVGGLGATHQADKTVEDIVNAVKPSIQSKLGTNISNLKVISYKTQLVNGTNYFVKVRTENGYAHLRIYKPFSGAASLVSVQDGKAKDDEITYF